MLEGLCDIGSLISQLPSSTLQSLGNRIAAGVYKLLSSSLPAPSSPSATSSHSEPHINEHARQWDVSCDERIERGV